MKVQVKLTNDSDWQEVEVVGFYDPAKHHTVRLEGSTKKIKFFQMKMNDGRVYDKEVGQWVHTTPDVSEVIVDTDINKLPYKRASVKTVKLVRALEISSDVVGLLKECHRVLADRGVVKATVYMLPSPRAYADPEFKNYFAESTFKYFKKGERYDLFSGVTTTVRGDVMEITLKK